MKRAIRLVTYLALSVASIGPIHAQARGNPQALPSLNE
jgi:hypothetical protein